MCQRFLEKLVVPILVSFSASVVSAQVRVIEGQYLYGHLKSGGQVDASGLSIPSEIKLLNKNNMGIGITSSEPKVVDFDSNDSTCSDLIRSGQATFCEPNFYVSASISSNDPMASDLYGLNLMGASQAWERSTGGSDVVVAVIDTGMDYRHPDLAANVWVNPGEIAGNGIDDDNDGWIDDVHGINAYSGTADPLDDNGHGTHVSGTIGAAGNNGLGVVGVNWNVKIMALKFLSSGGGGSIFGAIQAINYMIDMKTRYGLNLQVANNSWGGAGYSAALQEAISKANDAGIVFVAAAGNESNNNDILPSYPANYDLPNVVSVAAIDSTQTLAYFSNYGAIVDIAAPGVGILSTLLNGGYGKLSGTSMATPHVSGALGLLASYNPSLGVSGLISNLYSTATPVLSLSGKVRTAAMLNVAGMLGVSSTPISQPDPEVPLVSKLSLKTSRGSAAIHSGDALRILVTASSGSLDTPLEMFLNNKKCEQAKLVSLTSGMNQFRARVGSLSHGIKKLSIKIGEKKATKTIATSRYRSGVSARKISSRSFKVTCGRIAKTIQ